MNTHRAHARLAFRAGSFERGDRELPAEVAVALSYNGSTHAVMLATPADLEDFARGFSLTEGIATPEEIESITAVELPLGIDLQIWLADGAAARQQARRRSMAGPVGCGLCGIESLEEAMRRPNPVPASDFRIPVHEVLGAIAALERHQPLHDLTRAVHGTAFWTPEAGVIVAREDVGRHNALDKLIGAVLAGAGDPARGAALLTCRCSTDIVQKATAAGIPVLIAISTPTSAAVRMAAQSGLTLVGLARHAGFEIFTHPERIIREDKADVA